MMGVLETPEARDESIVEQSVGGCDTLVLEEVASPTPQAGEVFDCGEGMRRQLSRCADHRG